MGNGQKLDLPPPFNEIKHKNAGTILGKEINMNGSSKQAVKKRIEKAQHTWKQVNYKLLRNKAIAPRIKIILWNSLIRSTMIYGLHTAEIPPSQIKTLRTFMYKNIRAMMNPGLREDKWYPEKRQLYEKIQHPTMETWLEKTQIMTMLTQTRGKKKK